MSGTPAKRKQRTFTVKVLGRTLEHLGAQMYKRREPAIGELVANAWDAGATEVRITLPEPDNYDPGTSQIEISDNGCGMDEEQVQNRYLVVGLNRRAQDGDSITVSAEGASPRTRALMGRKGIGKLAGFGIATRMEVESWKEGVSVCFRLNTDDLNADAGEVQDAEIKGDVGPAVGKAWPSGTRVILASLRHKSPILKEKLIQSLARRFRRRVASEMSIHVNGMPVGEPEWDLAFRHPSSGENTATLDDGTKVQYWYGFSKKPIRATELRGFVIYALERTAQAPPFFFDVEGTASGQHSTRYVTGAISADFLDSGTTDDSDEQRDIISTDRQEIDWEHPRALPLKVWGEDLARKVLRECSDMRGNKLEYDILNNPQFAPRIKRLEETSRKQISFFLKRLAEADPDADKIDSLADRLIQAYEFRQFHDIIGDLEKAAEADPEHLKLLLDKIGEWRVLESRSILEIVSGRLQIISKFEQLLVNDAPETASKLSADNLHDLIGGNPWILNPEWQVLREETSITRQLREWGDKDIADKVDRERYDFLAISSDRRLVVIEIKRPGHPADLAELQRLERYGEQLSRAHGQRELYMVLICGPVLNVSNATSRTWKNAEDREVRLWSDLFDRTKSVYEHYRSILERNITDPDFTGLEEHVQQTRRIIEAGTVHRDRDARSAGLGRSDVDYTDGEDPAGMDRGGG